MGDRQEFILVHNVSHSDLLVVLAPDSQRVKPGTTRSTSTKKRREPLWGEAIARPKYSCFKKISESILAHISHNQANIFPIGLPSSSHASSTTLRLDSNASGISRGAHDLPSQLLQRRSSTETQHLELTLERAFPTNEASATSHRLNKPSTPPSTSCLDLLSHPSRTNSQSPVKGSHTSHVSSISSLSDLSAPDQGLCAIEEGDHEHSSGTVSPSCTERSSGTASPSSSSRSTKLSPYVRQNGAKIPSNNPNSVGTESYFSEDVSIRRGSPPVQSGKHSNASNQTNTTNNALKSDQFPVGYETSMPFDGGEWADFHVRSMTSSVCDREGYDYLGASDDEDDMTAHYRRQLNSRVKISKFFLPLISVIIPKWTDFCEKKRLPRSRRSSINSMSVRPRRHSDELLEGEADREGSNKVHKKLYLVSGSGAPRSPWHPPDGNSTECLARLIARFVSEFYSDIEVVVVHSGAGIFRYNDNVEFVNSELRPKILDTRSKLAHTFGERWASRFHLMLSLCDGAHARVASINACLRQFKPDLLHMWQLKSLWQRYPNVTHLWDNDVEFHSFTKMDVSPSRPLSKLDPLTTRLVEKMREFLREFEQIRDSPDQSHELATFWLRKTKQPVLAVLMTQKGEYEEPKFTRGVNMEVSMPTGSLCAERNAIGTALSSDLTLRRRDFKMIAVLSVRLHTQRAPSSHQPASSHGVLDSHSTCGAPLSLPRVPHDACHVHSATHAACFAASPKLSEIPKISVDLPDIRELDMVAPDSPCLVRRYSMTNTMVFSAQTEAHGHQTPTASLPMNSGSSQRKATTVASNPLNPCGACAEWLKKIAEANPNFKVITFDSVSCDSIYVKALL